MSFESLAGLIEVLLFGMVALSFGIWQVVKTRRLLRYDQQASQASPEPQVGVPDARVADRPID